MKDRIGRAAVAAQEVLHFPPIDTHVLHSKHVRQTFNIQVMQPGQPNCRYHSEPVQEDFLVLYGECIVILDGEERSLRQWDFFHCPAWTEHVVVGAGDGPCVVLMIGARTPDEVLHYPTSELADRYRAGATEATSDPRVAYAPFERSQRGRPTYWDQLPWA